MLAIALLGQQGLPALAVYCHSALSQKVSVGEKKCGTHTRGVLRVVDVATLQLHHDMDETAPCHIDVASTICFALRCR
jgi:hypothetical protein